jgi:serine/threonine protein kinase/tetratricopeptide (TPR) repeat protein
MPADLQKARELFLHAVGKLPPAEWDAYIAQTCAADTELAERVRHFLQVHRETGSFLESPAAALVATLDAPIAEHPGTVIGSYKLLEQIGEGGFGVVFMAEQQQPVRRKVALKILKPGMDTRQVVARFEAERQALAIMDHPNIAKVHDGGATPFGRPYVVMELVKGVPITEFCDQNHLTPKQRLELFIPVCQAVQHAHQKGIIHRDLKPSNILVVMHDATPVPKVIDFGVAKALGQELTDKTLFTGFAQMVGTPLYMSPEQAGQSALDIDTRSDIYSLGVLLYELLTGTTPFTRERFKQAAYDEIRRIIREEEPPRPSTRLSELGNGGRVSKPSHETESISSLASISAQRQTEPAKLTKLVRGELDWIVMKALEKDRNRRYETANGFAMDIQRYLADEPVLACPPSMGYRFKKLLSRNRGAVSAVSVVLLGLLVGGVGAVTGLLRAQTEAEAARQASNAEAAQNLRAQHNLRLALQVLDDIYLQVAQDRVPRDPQQEEKEHEMLGKALAFYQEFAKQNSADPAVPLEVIRANRRVGDIERLVGQHAGAGKAYAAAIAKAEQLVKDFPGNAEYSYELAVGLNSLGELLAETSELATADEQFRKAGEILRPLTNDSPKAHEYTAELARSHHGLGLTLKQRGERAAAEREFQQAINVQAKLVETLSAVPRYRVDLAQMHRSAGRWYRLGPGDYALAVEHLRSAVKLLRGLVKDFPAAPGYRYQLASALGELSIDGRENHWQESIALLRQLANDFPTVPTYRDYLAVSTHNMAYVQLLDGDFVSAAEPFGKAFDLTRKLVEDFPKVTRSRANFATSRHYRAIILIVRDKEFAKARPLLEQAVLEWRALAKTHPHNQRYLTGIVESGQLLAGVLAALGERALAAKQRQETEQAFADNVAEFEKAKDGPSVASFYCRETGAGLLLNGNMWMRIDRSAEATAAYRFAIKAYSKAVAVDPKSAGVLFAANTPMDFSRLGWGFQGGQKRAAIKKAAEIIDKLLEEIPDGPVRKRIRADILAARLATTSIPSPGKGEDSEKLYREAAALVEAFAVDCSDAPQDRDMLARAHYNLAEMLARNKQPQKAIKDYRQAIAGWEKLAADFRDKPEFRGHVAWTYNHLAAALIASKQPDEADKAYRDASALLVKLVEEFNEEGHRGALAYNSDLLGHLSKESGRFSQAAPAFRQAMTVWQKLHTDFRKDDYRRYQSLSHAWLIETLAAQARQIEKDGTLSDGDRRKKARACRHEAKELVQDGLKRGLQAPVWVNNTAWRLATDANPANRDPALAVELAKLAVKREPKQGMWWNTFGAAQYRAKDWKAAIEALEKSMELRNGGDSFDWFFVAMTHWQLGEKAKARQWLDRAVERMWLNEELWRFRAEAAALMGVGDPLPPFAEVHKAIDEAHVLAGQGQWQKAAAEYAQAAHALPGAGELWLEYASALVLAGDQEGYRRICADVLRRLAAVTDPETCYHLARTASLAPGGGDPAEAVQRAEKGVAAHPKQAWYLHTRALAHYRAGQFGEAVRRAQQSLRDDPAWGGHVVDWLLLAMAHQRQGHTAEARHWLDKAGQWIDQAGKGPPKEARFALPLPSWSDRLEAQILRREAERLIGRK